MLLYLFTWLVVAVVVCVLSLRLYCDLRRKSRNKPTVAFFHPFCNDGGGGERVLWVAVNALYAEFGPETSIVVYSGPIDKLRTQSIAETVKEQFGIKLLGTPQLVTLQNRWLVEEKPWPVARILFQSIGSMVLAGEALLRFAPDVVLDTHGFAFSYPVFRMAGCQVGCYVHYPTMSIDMIDKVKNPVKLIYYKLFHSLYGVMGSFSGAVMVNSTWTAGHIRALWPQQDIEVVFPPCDTSELVKFALSPRKRQVLSIGQFRPEKDHALQIESFALFLQQNPQFVGSVRLVVCGSTRKNNKDDEDRVRGLKELASSRAISEHVDFKVNTPYHEKLNLLKESWCALHTMWNEHFGIVLVEFMAAGVVTIGHKSGGPKLDIIQEYDPKKPKGYLADSREEYAQKLAQVFTLSEEERLRVQTNAREHCQNTFSDTAFCHAFISNLNKLSLISAIKKQQ